ncbi:hypothetical protein HZU75_04055 [Chitinibacter fontanus]|uniref:Uncharacterized protein n=1 Tax=Chitinibacter fontanus TaxID=1737446 RepID=A0A7D5ZB41_9NEIS|nr:hypothetical protein [Chitinibacter fontanus]QLI80766.1 hypothetical protein HZU75_04055 [Chitinibacter fontanus]
MLIFGQLLTAGSLVQLLCKEIRHRVLLWSLLASLLLHFALLLIAFGAPSNQRQAAPHVAVPSLQIRLMAANPLLVKESAIWSMPSAPEALPPDYGQALSLLAASQLNLPASAVAVADTEAELLNEPSFVPSDFSRASVNLQLAIEIDETGLVRQIHVLSGHLSDEEYPPIFAKIAQLQFRPAIRQGRGVASSKIYNVAFSAPAGD